MIKMLSISVAAFLGFISLFFVLQNLNLLYLESEASSFIEFCDDDDVHDLEYAEVHLDNCINEKDGLLSNHIIHYP